jgi:uncharacterized protein YkwD
VFYHDHFRRVLLGLGVIAALSTWTRVAAQGVDVERYREQVLALLNAERTSSGLPALRRVQALEQAAQAYSEAMMRATAGGPVFLSHLGPDGSTLGRRVGATGYVWYSLGETLAAGQKSPQQLVAEWMSSPLHRANVLSREYRDIGLGVAVGPGTWSDGRQDPHVIWWTANFGLSPSSSLDDAQIPVSPPVAGPGPTISGYKSLDGSPATQAQFGTLLLITGQNLGLSGAIRFHGRATNTVTWSPTAVMAWVPLQPSYPDIGPVTITVAGRTAIGPSFITVQPGNAVMTLPMFPSPAPRPAPTPAPEPGPSSGPPTITDLLTTAKQALTSIPQGHMFTIRGRGFGANAHRKSKVLFLTAEGTRVNGPIWEWANEGINVFAPYVQGKMEVVVLVEGSSGAGYSNRMPLTIR